MSIGRKSRLTMIVVSISVSLLGLQILASMRIDGSVQAAQETSTCQVSPAGPIGAVYGAYGEPPNALGLPVSGERRLFNSSPNASDRDQDLECGATVDKYQDFTDGSIYYVAAEQTAFALFGRTNAKYKELRGKTADDKAGLGYPITSEINDSNGNCKAYFSKGKAILCSRGNYEPVEIERNNIHLPELRLPSTVTITFNGGPHEYAAPDSLDNDDRITPSALDFDSGIVLAMADGTVVDVNAKKEGALYCWVAVRNDFSGTVIIYGHTEPNSEVKKGHHIKAGMPIGETTPSCYPVGAAHLHVELRAGAPYTDPVYTSLPDNLDNYSRWGSPVSWHGIVLDGYLISDGIDPVNNNILDYDGSAIKDVPNLNPHYAYSHTELVEHFRRERTEYVYETYQFMDEGKVSNVERSISSWMTKDTWETCNKRPEKNTGKLWCAGDKSTVSSTREYSGTVFPYGRFERSSGDILDEGASTSTLISSNTQIPYQPRPEPRYDDLLLPDISTLPDQIIQRLQLWLETMQQRFEGEIAQLIDRFERWIVTEGAALAQGLMERAVRLILEAMFGIMQAVADALDTFCTSVLFPTAMIGIVFVWSRRKRP